MHGDGDGQKNPKRKYLWMLIIVNVDNVVIYIEQDKIRRLIRLGVSWIRNLTIYTVVLVGNIHFKSHSLQLQNLTSPIYIFFFGTKISRAIFWDVPGEQFYLSLRHSVSYSFTDTKTASQGLALMATKTSNIYTSHSPHPYESSEILRVHSINWLVWSF